jgi:hypothetical protein
MPRGAGCGDSPPHGFHLASLPADVRANKTRRMAVRFRARLLSGDSQSQSGRAATNSHSPNQSPLLLGVTKWFTKSPQPSAP